MKIIDDIQEKLPYNTVVWWKDNDLYTEESERQLGIIVPVDDMDAQDFHLNILDTNGLVSVFKLGEDYDCIFEDLLDNVKVIQRCETFMEAINVLQAAQRDGFQVLTEL